MAGEKDTKKDTMRAARLARPGAELEITEVPVPELRPGGVLVRVAAVQVLPFTHAVLAGAAPFPLPTPYTPGSSAVGTVVAVAPDVSGLDVGQRVYLDPYLTSRVPGGSPAPLLIGWFALDEAASTAQRIWRDGTFAEYALWPAERVVALTGLDHVPATALATLNYLTIGFGALRRGELRPGQTVVITGATGYLGTAALLVALALGASRVVAAGRNRGVLAELAGVDQRISTTVLSGDPERDGAALVDASGGGAHLAVDLVGGGTGSAASAQAGLAALRPRGTLVLAGGVYAPLAVTYQTVLARELTVRGAFMAAPDAAVELAALIGSGQLRLDALTVDTYPLAEAAKAVASAAHCRGLRFAALVP
jgi:alcohol dehydrogenase